MGLTQSELASRIGITMARLANYEDGRGCLRCGIAFDICRNLVISEKWLATGTGKKNCYRDVASFFPNELLPKSFIALYESEIEGIYNEHEYGLDSFVPLLKYDDLHPDTWRIACFKILQDFSQPITDNRSLTEYWRNVAEYAGRFGEKYATTPRERLTDLDSELSVIKDGQQEPFSYVKFFDDLALIGLEWSDIESIAQGLLAVARTTTTTPFLIEELKERVLDQLQESGLDNAATLYKKIYCGN